MKSKRDRMNVIRGITFMLGWLAPPIIMLLAALSIPSSIAFVISVTYFLFFGLCALVYYVLKQSFELKHLGD